MQDTTKHLSIHTNNTTPQLSSGVWPRYAHRHPAISQEPLSRKDHLLPQPRNFTFPESEVTK